MRMLYFFGLIALVLACQSTTQDKNKEQQAQHTTSTKPTETNYLEKGDQITSATQAVLLKTVSQAVAQKGAHGAVEYCNLKALSIVDSLSQVHNCQIRRISDKYRNPQDKAQNEAEQKALQTFLTKYQKQEKLAPFTLQEGEHTYYFKPIIIGMETCLKCHGKEKDIDEKTLNTINKLYPNDLAKGYTLKAFRGAWVVKF